MNPHRHPKAKEAKYLLALDREQDLLCKEARALEPLPVAVPFQAGWLRYFVLTDRAKQRRDAAVLEAILEEINVVEHCHIHPGSISRRRHGKRWKAFFDRQQLRMITQRQYAKLRWPPEWLRYFDLLPQFVCPLLGRRFAQADLFRFEVVPRIVTHTNQICPRIERRLAEIDQELTPRRRGRLDHLYGYRRWRDRHKLFEIVRADEDYHQQIRELRDDGVISQALCLQGFLGFSDHVFILFRTSSIEVMQRAFNARSRERYPGGPFHFIIMGDKH